MQFTIEDILRRNIEALLDARGMRQADLARMVGGGRTRRRSGAWLSRILNPPQNPKERRGMRLPDVERVAKVFGLAPHELLTPGISRYTERRRCDRRSGRERRAGDRRKKQFPPSEVMDHDFRADQEKSSVKRREDPADDSDAETA